MWRLLSIAFAAVLAMSVAVLRLPLDKGNDPSSPRGNAGIPASAFRVSSATDRGGIVLARTPAGRFEISALVNGQETEFLVDTGADMLAISIDDAERLGVPVNPDDFIPIARTASGVAMGARVELQQIEIAGQEFHEVEAIVLEGLGANLLGQSLLRRMGRMEIHEDQLTIARS